MRYFGRIAYNGTQYVGWQYQPNGKSIQQQLEEVLSVILRESVSVMGCGRTDAGVHASEFYFHFDCNEILNKALLLNKLNGLLPGDIVFTDIIPVAHSAHARFDAEWRTYRYYVSGCKDPFRANAVFYHTLMFKTQFESVCRTAEVISGYWEFFPFCKSNSQTPHYLCNIKSIKWSAISDQHWVFEVTANRFLRGMIRLMVGSCLMVGMGKTDLEDIVDSLENQSELTRPWSVPGHGLYLCGVEYPYIESVENGHFFEPFGPVPETI